MNDSGLRKHTTRLKSWIAALAAKYRYNDYKLWEYLEYHHDEPAENESCACVLTCDGQMLGCLDGYYGDEFTSSLTITSDKAGFYYEQAERGVFHFYHCDETINEEFKELLEWQWITHLIQPEYSDLYDELFGFFEKNPEKLYSIKPRQLELYAGEIFKHKGYEVIMGPGANDGGIDLRIYQKTDIDPVTTLVQVKKYKNTLPIRLDAVAALYGHVEAEKASQGLFITTSRYLPGTKLFADRLSKKILLTDRSHLVAWSSEVKSKIMRDRGQMISDSSLLSLVEDVAAGKQRDRLWINTFYSGYVDCEFALILKETKYAALLILLPVQITEWLDPPYNTCGRKKPLLDSSILRNKTGESVFRCTVVSKGDKSKAYSGRSKYFTAWNGEPYYFDVND